MFPIYWEQFLKLRGRQPFDGRSHSILEWRGRLVEPGAAKFCHVGLGEALIAPRQVGRHVDKPNVRLSPECSEHREGKIEEGSRTARARVEHSARRRVSP